MATRRLARFRAHQSVVAVALVVYLLVASLPRQEIFPFFDWGLFSVVPKAEETDYGLRLFKVDGVELAEPTFFEESEGLFSSATSPNSNEMIQALGRAVRSEDEEAARHALALIRTAMLDGRAADIEIVLRTYDIVDRARFRNFTAVVPLRRFEVAEIP